MIEIELKNGKLDKTEQEHLQNGFSRHAKAQDAPGYDKERVNWVAYNENKTFIGVLTADILWDWMYIDELWVHENFQGKGLGKKLLSEAETHGRYNNLTGIWLWTQDWQAAGFYERTGFVTFARFPDFPKGHERIGYRKIFV